MKIRELAKAYLDIYRARQKEKKDPFDLDTVKCFFDKIIAQNPSLNKTNITQLRKSLFTNNDSAVSESFSREVLSFIKIIKNNTREPLKDSDKTLARLQPKKKSTSGESVPYVSNNDPTELNNKTPAVQSSFYMRVICTLDTKVAKYAAAALLALSIAAITIGTCGLTGIISMLPAFSLALAASGSALMGVSVGIASIPPLARFFDKKNDNPNRDFDPSLNIGSARMAV